MHVLIVYVIGGHHFGVVVRGELPIGSLRGGITAWPQPTR
jgi:hypothetical protein